MALYAKMKGPVDYTVVGSPTITDGIVSDFTYDDYFKSAQAISTTGISSFEFYARVKTPSAFAEGWCRICHAGSFGNQGTTAGIWSNSSVTQSFFHMFGIDIYQQLLTTDTWYRIQYLYSPSSYTATVYDDNGNVLKSYTYSDPKLNLQGVINFCQRYSNYVLGAIDLNNTYIKVNGQLWFGNGFDRVKIRTAPYVKYTVTGTPTIVDNVMSNFSNSNYATTTSAFEVANYDNVEIYVRAKTPVTTSAGWTDIIENGGVGSYRNLGAYANSELTAYYFNFFGHDFWRYNISADTWYRLKLTTTADTQSGYIYDDNGNLLYQSENLARRIAGTSVLSFGGRYSANKIGAIDFNNTYIKVNGQYWWRGDMQNVETYTPHIFAPGDYFIEGNKIVQANPNMYIRISDWSSINYNYSQYIDTGIAPTQNTTFEIVFKHRETIANEQNVFGGAYNYNDNGILLARTATYGFFCRVAATSTRNLFLQAGTIEEGVKTTLSLTKSENVYSLLKDGTSVVTGTLSDAFTSTSNVYIFNRNLDNTTPQSYRKFQGNLYSLKFYESGVLIRDFRPVPQGLVVGTFTVPSNGMWDMVTQQFYPNSGTGSFDIGKDE